MENESQEYVFEKETVLRLVVPKGAGIPMLPLAEFKQYLSTLLMAMVFFGLYALILGSLLSLFNTGYDNYPVMNLLVTFFISYFILLVVFLVRGVSGWKKLKEKSLGVVPWSKESLTERIGALEHRLQLYKIHHDIGIHVFNGVTTLPYDDFNKTVEALLPFEPDDPRCKKFIQRLIAEKIIVLHESEPDNWLVSYETYFEATA